MHWSAWVRICGFLLWLAAACEAPSSSWGQESPKPQQPAAIEPVATPDQVKEIAALIAQLGDNRYIAREEASARLAEIGVPAEGQLREASKNPDAEIRHRATRLLVVVAESAFASRLQAFADDIEGTKKLSMPGWDQFKQVVGEDRHARALFVDIQRADAELMDTYSRNPKAAAQHFELRCFSLQQTMNNRQGFPNAELTLGHIVGLLFIATDPKITVSEQGGSYLYQFVQRAEFRTGMTNDTTKSMLRKLLGMWVGRKTNANVSLGYQNVLLAMQYDLKEGIGPAIDIAKQPGGQAYFRLYALLAIGKLGTAEQMPVIEPLLEDKSSWQLQINNKQVNIEVRDAALAVLVHLSGGNPKEYGFKNLTANGQFLYDPQSLYFEDGKARDEALQKWKDKGK